MTATWNEHLHIFALDVGTPRVNRVGSGFAWARDPALSGTVREWSGSKSPTLNSPLVMENLVDEVVASMKAGRPVALGFECPTYIPVHSSVDTLGGARSFDGSHSWSASPGALVMASGMAQTAWILSTLAKRVASEERATTFAWAPFREGRARLLLWEAFISGAAKKSGVKRSTHADDADLAVRLFSRDPRASRNPAKSLTLKPSRSGGA